MQRLTQLPLDRDDLKESWKPSPGLQNFEAVISSHDSHITGASQQLQLWNGHCKTRHKPSWADIYAHLTQCSVSLWRSADLNKALKRASRAGVLAISEQRGFLSWNSFINFFHIQVTLAAITVASPCWSPEFMWHLLNPLSEVSCH